MLNGNRYMHPTVCARKISISFHSAIEEAELRLTTELFLADLIRSLRNEGCGLIGHIKGLFAADAKGHLKFSVTSFDEATHFNGELRGGIISAVMTLNIIVYGVGLEIVEAAFEEAFHKHMSAHEAGSGSRDE